MKQDEILEMARQAGVWTEADWVFADILNPKIEAFAKLVAAKTMKELENSLILMSEVNISNNFKQSQRTEQNFCSRCGKRTADLTTIHTCTPPQD
jgi:hypothetical protein